MSSVTAAHGGVGWIGPGSGSDQGPQASSSTGSSLPSRLGSSAQPSAPSQPLRKAGRGWVCFGAGLGGVSGERGMGLGDWYELGFGGETAAVGEDMGSGEEGERGSRGCCGDRGRRGGTERREDHWSWSWWLCLSWGGVVAGFDFGFVTVVIMRRREVVGGLDGDMRSAKPASGRLRVRRAPFIVWINWMGGGIAFSSRRLNGGFCLALRFDKDKVEVVWCTCLAA